MKNRIRLRDDTQSRVVMVVGYVWVATMVLAALFLGHWWYILLPPPCPMGMCIAFGIYMIVEGFERRA